MLVFPNWNYTIITWVYESPVICITNLTALNESVPFLRSLIQIAAALRRGGGGLFVCTVKYNDNLVKFSFVSLGVHSCIIFCTIFPRFTLTFRAEPGRL